MAIAEKHFVLFLPAKPTISSEESLAGGVECDCCTKEKVYYKVF